MKPASPSLTQVKTGSHKISPGTTVWGHFELSDAKDPKRRAALAKQYCRGWFIGSKEEKKALAKDMAEKHPDVDWEGADLQALNQAQWESIVCAQMRRLKQDEASLLTTHKGAAWKIEIAHCSGSKPQRRTAGSRSDSIWDTPLESVTSYRIWRRAHRHLI